MKRHVVVAGAGIAGLTAALAFAAQGFNVSVYERADTLEEAGAGLQLSPNATRILDRLGVTARLDGKAVAPQAILLKDAASLRPLGRVPLGRKAEARWGAAYLVVHRADLQGALAEVVGETPSIRLMMGESVDDAAFQGEAVAVRLSSRAQIGCGLLVAADGVWSRLRRLASDGQSRFSGHVAHRAVVRAGDVPEGILSSKNDSVCALLAPGFHLVAYPVQGGSQVNLVAVTRGRDLGRRWTSEADMTALVSAMAGASPRLRMLVSVAAPWRTWPLHTVGSLRRWHHPGGMALIGDAAHALTPYAAQGAAMAIEDAALLAVLHARGRERAAMLQRFETLRKPRLKRVAARGRFNRFAWHAGGLVARARNLALHFRSEERLLADLDWLYGYDVEAAPGA